MQKKEVKDNSNILILLYCPYSYLKHKMVYFLEYYAQYDGCQSVVLHFSRWSCATYKVCEDCSLNHEHKLSKQAYTDYIWLFYTDPQSINKYINKWNKLIKVEWFIWSYLLFLKTNYKYGQALDSFVMSREIIIFTLADVYINYLP